MNKSRKKIDLLKEMEKYSHSIEIGRFKLIAINSELEREVQREQFYHELAHILRHAGRQIMMPKAFRELQEWDANNFTRYAALPLHMLREFNLNDDNIIDQLSEEFKVTKGLCEYRLERIYANLINIRK
ncbi:ImmA/IrrE family metallo-endopeptidase [Halalkalibacterium ligniniphilum]|uniref:ImmA/IrrE family metallo-endopeptidase n=1 Tax=Halalkalibacterium ligniniphilum TaxID=1134413 RepID=UPI0003703A18|nr:ImmA/IrrE family metallo-endopeptidase [Halalkalibacterium ligniniphilum]